MADGNFPRSRRDVLKAGALTAATAAAPFVAGAAAAQGQDPQLDRLAQSAGDAKRRILLKGATVLSMDTAVGDFARADILIEGKKIAAVGPDLGAASANGNAIVIEAADRVVIPGMVDCHRHAWEGQLRGINPNSATIGDYMGATHRGFAPFYQPEDMYVGNLTTALGCIDAGITCIIDNSHNARSPAHSDEAIQALFDSGMRAVHASGAATSGEWDHQWPQDSERLKKQFSRRTISSSRSGCSRGPDQGGLGGRPASRRLAVGRRRRCAQQRADVAGVSEGRPARREAHHQSRLRPGR